MSRVSIATVLAAATIGSFVMPAVAQHLWWNESPSNGDATCIYGEITILATHPGIYYCGANWHPGEPAGGYCGIQDNSADERRTIFSIWDTSPTLHPMVTQADPKTIFNRFGGEGEGAHTHMLWQWKKGETFQFFVRKLTGNQPDTTDACYYIFDRKTGKWRHSATITCPNGDPKSESSVKTIGGGGLASFLENFVGKDQEVPKIALYRLWLGTDIDKMKCLTKARGDGVWGQLHGTYFLAEGDAQQLEYAFSELKEEYGVPVFGNKESNLAPIPNKPLPKVLIKQLKSLPVTDKVSASSKQEQ